LSVDERVRRQNACILIGAARIPGTGDDAVSLGQVPEVELLMSPRSRSRAIHGIYWRARPQDACITFV
jgi:hypothetical protein